MTKLPAKKHADQHVDKLFEMFSNEMATEEMVETASHMIEVQLKYALQLTVTILDNTDGNHSVKEIFEIFDQSCAAISRNMGFDQLKD